ncbi:heat shock cognate 71 kDa protein-like [Varroa destructor]|uniref:Uncharacterized protein n=1 Tax=Varroa destructor TaxID=109461 RepID=A0A7M7J6N7_VARDE|nr:heat shock cognate 71 kDa protein-like [Varroa destructor]
MVDKGTRSAGASAPPRSPAIGIDLGTTNSCVGIFRNGKVEIMTNDQGSRKTASLVAFTEDGLLIGEPATRQVTTDPANTIFNFKRLLGRRYTDPIIQNDMKTWPFEVVNERGWPKIRIDSKGEKRCYFPEKIQSMLLLKMKGIAESYLGEMVTDAVITVPAHFNEYQKQATRDAAKIAGLNVMRILKESAATGIAYKVLHSKGIMKDEHNILIFDLGGGSFDVSILSIHDGVLEMKSTSGDTHLGGEDFDSRLVEYFASEFKAKHRMDPTSDKIAMRRLRVACERVKRTLSTATEAAIEVESFFENIALKSSISRSKFEELCGDLFGSTLEPVRKALQYGKIDKSHIHDIIVVGGCTNIPRIQELLKEFFNGKELNKSISREESVAYGAALQAGILTQDSHILENLLLLDVTPHPLGIETVNGVMTFLVKSDTAIPTRISRGFSTCSENQPAVTIKIFEGYSSFTKDNNMLAKFTMTGIPQGGNGIIRIEVTFSLDADGTLEVTALHKPTGRRSKITVFIDKEHLLEDDTKDEDGVDYPIQEYKDATKASKV